MSPLYSPIIGNISYSLWGIGLSLTKAWTLNGDAVFISPVGVARGRQVLMSCCQGEPGPIGASCKDFILERELFVLLLLPQISAALCLGSYYCPLVGSGLI